ncbi:hypothetical protein [Paenarthrobacter sp. AMU7]|uniref:Uncharacterized protein n=1 Tax=Paenarthrobacter sp. AMU7 TaxID=3162492 RepID=A0AB39YQQ4_9MICC
MLFTDIGALLPGKPAPVIGPDSQSVVEQGRIAALKVLHRITRGDTQEATFGAQGLIRGISSAGQSVGGAVVERNLHRRIKDPHAEPPHLNN